MSTTGARPDVIGRDEQIAAVEAFLDLVMTGPAALVVSGEPGIGKSTVWRAGVSSARFRSFRIMLCGPAETEAGLSFVGLADLLDGFPREAFADIPAPQHAFSSRISGGQAPGPAVPWTKRIGSPDPTSSTRSRTAGPSSWTNRSVGSRP